MWGKPPLMCVGQARSRVVLRYSIHHQYHRYILFYSCIMQQERLECLNSYSIIDHAGVTTL